MPAPGPSPAVAARRGRRQSAILPFQRAPTHTNQEGGDNEDGGVATTEDFSVLQDALAHLRRSRQGLLNEIKASHSTIERLQVENTKLNLLLEGSLAQQRELRTRVAEEGDATRRLRAEASRAAREAEIKAAERWETERARLAEEHHKAMTQLESSFEDRINSVRDAVAEQWSERLRLARQAASTREADLRKKLQEQAKSFDGAVQAVDDRARKEQEALRERLRGHVLAEVEGAAQTFAGLYKQAAAHVREKIRVRSWDDRVKELMDEKAELQRQLALRDEEMEMMRRERGRAREVEFAALEEFLWRRTRQATEMRYCLQALARDNASLLARLVGSRRRAVDLGAKPPSGKPPRLTAPPSGTEGGGGGESSEGQPAGEGKEEEGKEERKEPVFHAPPAMRLYAPAPLYAELRRLAPALASALPLPAGVREAVDRVAEASRRAAEASRRVAQAGREGSSELQGPEPAAHSSPLENGPASAEESGSGSTSDASETTVSAEAAAAADRRVGVLQSPGGTSGRHGSAMVLGGASVHSSGSQGRPSSRPRAMTMPEPPSVRQAVSPGRVLSAAGLGRRTYQSPTRAESRASLVGRAPGMEHTPGSPAGTARSGGGSVGAGDARAGVGAGGSWEALLQLPPAASTASPLHGTDHATEAVAASQPASSRKATPSAGARPLARALEAALLAPSPSGRAWRSSSQYGDRTAAAGTGEREGEEGDVDDSSSAVSASSILLATAASLFSDQGGRLSPSAALNAPVESDEEEEEEEEEEEGKGRGDWDSRIRLDGTSADGTSPTARIRSLLQHQRSLGESVDKAAELASSRVVFGEWVACPRPDGSPSFYANVHTGDLVSSGVGRGDEGAEGDGRPSLVPHRPQWRMWLMHALMSSGEEGRALAVAFDAAEEGEEDEEDKGEDENEDKSVKGAGARLADTRATGPVVPHLRADAELAPEGVPTLGDLMASARGARVLAPLGASSSDQRMILGGDAWWRSAEGHDRLHAAAAVRADEAIDRAGSAARKEAEEMLRHARRDALDE